MCTPLNAASKLGSFPLYNPDDKIKPCCQDRRACLLGVPVFFGKGPDNKPLFAVVDYDQFKIAKRGTVVATVAASVFGIAAVVLLYKNMKSVPIFTA